MNLSTIESARIALALGPVETTCNVCGGKHILDCNASPFFYDSPVASCLSYRAHVGILATYYKHSTAFAQMHHASCTGVDLVTSVIDRLPSLIAPRDGSDFDDVKCIETALTDLQYILEDIYAIMQFVCKRLARNISIIASNFLCDTIWFPDTSSFDGAHAASSWIIMLPEEVAHNHIYKMCMNTVTDEIPWKIFDGVMSYMHSIISFSTGDSLHELIDCCNTIQKNYNELLAGKQLVGY